MTAIAAQPPRRPSSRARNAARASPASAVAVLRLAGLARLPLSAAPGAGGSRLPSALADRCFWSATPTQVAKRARVSAT